MKKVIQRADSGRGRGLVFAADTAGKETRERATAHLGWSLTAELLDKAIDRAARVTEAVVAQFAAAPSEVGYAHDGPAHRVAGGLLAGIPAVEIAVEFFVPPVSVDHFRHELEGQLQRNSSSYLAARSRGELGPVIVRPIPSGAFHQWRIVWRTTSDTQHRQRWSSHRGMLDSLLDQARNGWREVAV